MPSEITNKRVCFLCHPFHRGGVTKWMIEAATDYVRLGWETWFITVKPEGFISGKDRPSMWELLKSIDNLKLIAFPENRSFELGTLMRRSLAYATTIYENVPPGTPVILSDDESVWMAGKIISSSYPIIGVLHSDDEVYYSLYQKYYQILSGIVAVSERIKIKALNFIDKNNIAVIPCGINLPTLNNTGNEGVLKIIWVGRIEERQKRVSDIPKIGKKLIDTGIQFHWTIAGHGDENSLKENIRLMGMEEYFSFTGWINQKELYNLMDKSDLLVLPSNFEGMPVVVMEALSKGLGVVSSRVSGVEDLVKDVLANDVLRVYDIGDIDQAVNSIKEISLISNEVRVSAARKLAEYYYSIQSCVDKYIEVLENIVFVSGKSNIWKLKLQLILEKIKSFFLSNIRYWKYKLLSSN